MFTGIVQAVGTILAAQPRPEGVRLEIDPGELPIDDVGIGDSIAVGGCCLTVVARSDDPRRLGFDVSDETLRCTAGLAPGARANLEKALRLADRLGGHLMTGHVDGVGKVTSFAPVVGSAAGEGSWRLQIEVPSALARFVAAKGSVAVQGVSLTVNEVQGATFAVNLIPHTLQVTTLRDLTSGASVNLEVDLVARYIERLAQRD